MFDAVARPCLTLLLARIVDRGSLHYWRFETDSPGSVKRSYIVSYVYHIVVSEQRVHYQCSSIEVGPRDYPLPPLG